MFVGVNRGTEQVVIAPPLFAWGYHLLLDNPAVVLIPTPTEVQV